MLRKLLVIFLILTSISVMVLSKKARSFTSFERKVSVEDKLKNKLVISHTEIFGTLERPQVVFDHGRHADAFKKEGCSTCHPLAPDGNHIFDFPFKAANKTAKEIEDLYHEKCISCHKKIIKEKKKSLPVRCGDCHVKKFESFTIKYPIFEFDFALHDKHVKKLKEKTGKDDCGLCHHTYDIQEENEALRLVYEKGTEESCYYCHELGGKRGLELTAIMEIAVKKGLSIKKASHQQCLNCHLEYKKKGDKETGPTDCMKCHTGKYKTVAELEKVPRPDRDQPEKPFITIENAQMKGIPFNHAVHEKNTKTCRECHHETLNACKKCHNLLGRPEGKGVNTANAYHNVFSGKSCAGCHNKKKALKDCAGCHHHLLDMDLQAKGPKKEICSVCHSGKKEGPISGRQISIAALKAQKIPEKVTIKVLENQYEPSTFPHFKIVERLAGISNESKMAISFHRNMQTICNGCHHQSNADAEAKKGKPLYCRNCHTLSFDPQNMNRPRLLAAYHRQCMGCHEKMNIDKAMKCADCHKAKKVITKSILSKTLLE